jgi:formylglycine-generating enzyme required for sulfatase activity
MVAVRGGTFQMGSNEGSSDEKPVHSVTVGNFYMSKYEVTNAQYAAFLNAKGNQSEGGVEWYDASGAGSQGYAAAAIRQQGGRWTVLAGRENHPVNYVSWHGAAAYCKWLSEQTGHRYRLPTEAEWEYAAGGGSSNRTKYAGTDDALGEYAWYTSNTNDTGTRPVGGKRANSLGLHDMSGNVWEWCADWYGSDYYASSPSSNPAGPSSGAGRVRRGGGWDYDATICRVAYRAGVAPGFRGSGIGFRPSRTP